MWDNIENAFSMDLLNWYFASLINQKETETQAIIGFHDDDSLGNGIEYVCTTSAYNTVEKWLNLTRCNSEITYVERNNVSAYGSIQYN